MFLRRFWTLNMEISKHFLQKDDKKLLFTDIYPDAYISMVCMVIIIFIQKEASAY